MMGVVDLYDYVVTSYLDDYPIDLSGYDHCVPNLWHT